jgi:hypothetical protein
MNIKNIEFTEEDIEKMALEYIELTKEATTYGGVGNIGNELHQAILTYIGNGVMDENAFNSAVRNYLYLQFQGVTKRNGNIQDNTIKTTIITDLKNDIIKEGYTSVQGNIRNHVETYNKFKQYVSTYDFNTLYSTYATEFLAQI